MKSKLFITLDVLKDSGVEGVHAYTLISKVGVISVGSIVGRLRKQGCIIETKRETLKGIRGMRYFFKGQKIGSMIFDKPEKKHIRYRFEGDKAIPIIPEL